MSFQPYIYEVFKDSDFLNLFYSTELIKKSQACDFLIT